MSLSNDSTTETTLFQTKTLLSDEDKIIRRSVGMSEEVKVGKRYTLVVPKTIREELKLKEGQRVLMQVQEGRILIEPLPQNPFAVLGEIVGESYDESVEEERAERWLKEHAGR